MARIALPSSVQSWSDNSRSTPLRPSMKGDTTTADLLDTRRQPAITLGNRRDDLRHALLVQQPRNRDRELVEGATPKLDEVRGVRRVRAVDGGLHVGAERQES